MIKCKLFLALLLITATAFSQRQQSSFSEILVKGLEPPTNLQAVVTDNVVQLSWTAPGGGGSQEELIYDNNLISGSYSFVGYTMSTRMSPTQDCQVLKIKFYTTNDGDQVEFQPKIFNWEGSQPGTTLLYSSTQNSVSDGWVEFDISEEGVFPDGDFLVGFGSFHEDVYLGYDADLNNGRSWDFEQSSSLWYSHNETYIIRATVLYPNGDVVELGGKTPDIIKKGTDRMARENASARINPVTPSNNLNRSLKGLLGYSVFRDGILLNDNPISETLFNDIDLPDGTYTYSVKAVYDEGISDPAGPIIVSVPGNNLPPPLNLGGVLSGDEVKLWWVNPDGGTVVELMYDNNVATEAYKFPGTTMSTRMSPAHPCQLLKIKYFTTVDGSNNRFNAKVFGWEGSMPGNYAYFKEEAAAIDQSWVEIDLEDKSLYFETDFVVGFGSFSEESFLGYDANLDNDRSWDFNESTQTWTTWDEAYLIRAVVRYGDGSVQELASGKGLQGYNLYRNGEKMNAAVLSSTEYTDLLPSYGDFNYQVTAVYDEGESNVSNTASFSYHLGVEEESMHNITLYPNPANGAITIAADEKIERIRILGLDGRVHMEDQIMTESTRLDIGHLPAGIYILESQMEKRSFTAKLLVY